MRSWMAALVVVAAMAILVGCSGNGKIYTQSDMDSAKDDVFNKTREACLVDETKQHDAMQERLDEANKKLKFFSNWEELPFGLNEKPYEVAVALVAADGTTVVLKNMNYQVNLGDGTWGPQYEAAQTQAAQETEKAITGLKPGEVVTPVRVGLFSEVGTDQYTAKVYFRR